jgi:hypothetical protein
MLEADCVFNTPNDTVVQIADFRKPIPSPEAAVPVSAVDYSDDIDRKSAIIRAAVIYTANQAAYDGAFLADHTDNLVLAGGYLADRHTRLRDSALRRLTRHIRRAKQVRPVELWAVASVASVLVGGADAINLEKFEHDFLRAFFQLVERDCESRARPASNVGGSSHDA